MVGQSSTWLSTIDTGATMKKKLERLLASRDGESENGRPCGRATTGEVASRGRWDTCGGGGGTCRARGSGMGRCGRARRGVKWAGVASSGGWAGNSPGPGARVVMSARGRRALWEQYLGLFGVGVFIG